jgi:hypothetical protein
VNVKAEPLREAIARAICCPKGCVRNDDCLAGDRREHREIAAAILALAPPVVDRSADPVLPGSTITVIIPSGYDTAWDFLNDCGLESVPTVDREAVIEQAVRAARSAYEGCVADFVMIGPSGVAGRMIGAIRALADAKVKP